MRVLIDTNVLISAAIFPAGAAAKAYLKSTEQPYSGVLCDFCVDEFKRIVRKKFSKYETFADAFLAAALVSAEIVGTPTGESAGEAAVRDINDRPIFRAAVLSGVDIILSGDKDFLESGIKKPVSLSPAEFLARKE
jgi:putative PIN family toxin of toxin-antitoxin system